MGRLFNRSIFKIWGEINLRFKIIFLATYFWRNNVWRNLINHSIDINLWCGSNCLTNKNSIWIWSFHSQVQTIWFHHITWYYIWTCSNMIRFTTAKRRLSYITKNVRLPKILRWIEVVAISTNQIFVKINISCGTLFDLLASNKNCYTCMI